MALNNFTDASNLTAEDTLNDIRIGLDKYITPILYVVGFPGNIISLIIWLQKRMRHSSGYYLAALALDDLIFLALHLMFELHETWGVPLLNHPVICEMYPILFMSSQYLSPFLVLAFTTERYISICHPFQREKYCSVKRAKIVIICLVGLMLCLNAAHGYFFHYSHLNGDCNVRLEALVGETKSFYTVYNTTIEMLVFLVVPVTVLVLNIFVIREMRRLSRVEQVQLQGSSQRTGSTTVMLLAVSFYQIITTLPISITYALYFEYDCSVSKCQDPDKIRRSRIYYLILTVIKEYGITHYAFNIFIYIITGKMFRQELQKLILRPFLKLAPRLPRDYTSLRTSTRGNDTSRTWVSVNGNHETERSTDETLL